MDGGGSDHPVVGPGTPVVFLDGVTVPQLPDAGVCVVALPGVSGPIEAIAYGGDDWLYCPRLVVALHGGPLGAWQLTHHPDLSLLRVRLLRVGLLRLAPARLGPSPLRQ